MNIVTRLLKEKLGVSKAIAFTSIARATQGIGGFVTVFLVSRYLTQEEQGYYYTFGSLLSVQIFIELGLGGIITQFVAHEYAHLHVDESGCVSGNPVHLSRLASLTHFFAKWYLAASVLLFCILIILGFNFFRTYSVNDNIEWRGPWMILIVSTSLNLLLSPIFAFFDGINKVKDVAFIRMVTQMVSLICVWAILICGGKLYTSALTSTINLVISASLLINYKGHLRILKSIAKAEIKVKVSYLKEIFPYQWKIALSWMSGYFIFQLFNPVLFAYCGPEAAGHMGMTMAVLNGILNLTLSWTTTNVPKWSSLIAVKQYDELDSSFSKVLKASSAVCLSGIIAFLIILFVIGLLQLPIYGRFLPFYLVACMSITIFVNNIINAWATYLRCHKKEPFLIQAVVVGISSGLSTIMTAKFIGVNGVVIGYTLVNLLISLPLSYYIYTTKKRVYNV